MVKDFNPRGRVYGRGDARPPGPGPMKGRGDWVEPEYPEHEWDNRGRRPMEWENREGWDNMDRPHPPEEEWRHFNRGMESWPPNDNRRRWPNRNNDWRDRDNSRPRSAASHNVEPIMNEDSNMEARRKETPTSSIPPQRSEPVIAEPSVDPKQAPVQSTDQELESGTAAPKRPAEEPAEGANEAKKVCAKAEPTPVLEDDLSEISDDADEILNRVEEILEESVIEHPQSQTTESDIPSQEPVTSTTASQKSQSPVQSPAKSVQKEESIDGENMDLDFEEISEDELDEESRVKGIGDALGVDWASLVAESRPRLKPMSSAKLRWEPHNVLVNLGISVRLAGEDLVKEVLKEHAEAEMKLEIEEKAKQNFKIKVEPTEVNINGIKQEIKEEPEENIKEEPKEEPKIDPEDLNISHPIAAIQVANQETQQIRRTLFTSVGPHRRALSARRDLMIRRHLSNLPIKDTYVEAPKRHDPELFKIATQLFERCL